MRQLRFAGKIAALLVAVATAGPAFAAEVVVGMPIAARRRPPSRRWWRTTTPRRRRGSR